MLRICLIALLLAACSPRGEITLDPAAAGVGTVERVFVGTTRAIDPATGTFERKKRSEMPHYARFDISIPPDHTPGTITWPKRGRAPNPQTDFLTVDQVIYPSDRPFRADLSAALRHDKGGRREAVIFVHGFNNTFSEGLYRIAQLSNDLGAPGVVVHYAWPSAGNALAYVQDRDSVMFARDGLETLIDEVIASGATGIILVAHSMGAALTMETLRQIAIERDARTLAHIAGVVLISPDIDVDVFRSQAHRIGALPQPFLIFGSGKDRALNMSARITGQPERLGNLTDISRLADLKVTYLDTAAYGSGDGHFNVGNSPALLALLSRITDLDQAFGADMKGRTGLLSGVVLTVRNATEIVLAPVEALAGQR